MDGKYQTPIIKFPDSVKVGSQTHINVVYMDVNDRVIIDQEKMFVIWDQQTLLIHAQAPGTFTIKVIHGNATRASKQVTVSLN